jgi:CheY-like chemotaxis protein
MTDHPHIALRTYCTDHIIYFEIEDNGCGIPKDQIEMIFDPAFTLKGSRDTIGSYKSGIQGTGYGMANVKKCIEKHNGKIDVFSVVGQGTKIKMCLPIVYKELSHSEIYTIQQNEYHSGKHILLAEDEKAISDVQYRILTGDPCRHNVDIAANGQTAIDLYNKNFYNIIILDCMLPGKISGMDIYHYIRENDPKIPILFVSGNLEFLESIKDLKHNDSNIEHVSKPCPNIVYLEEINKLLNNL